MPRENGVSRPPLTMVISNSSIAPSPQKSASAPCLIPENAQASVLPTPPTPNPEVEEQQHDEHERQERHEHRDHAAHKGHNVLEKAQKGHRHPHGGSLRRRP